MSRLRLYLDREVPVGETEDLCVYELIISQDGMDMEKVLAIKPEFELRIVGCKVELPANAMLNWSCGLTLDNADMEYLPTGLNMTDKLEIINTPIRFIPPSVERVTALYLEGKRVKCAFPDFLEVENMSLTNTSIKQLPSSLYVEEELSLIGSPINRLPSLLEVGGCLNISGCDDISISGNEEVLSGECLRWVNAPWEHWPDNWLVFGSINLEYSKIGSLPDNFTVDGDLELAHARLKRLPENPTVSGDLDISFTDIDYLPDSLVVFGDIRADSTCLSKEDCIKARKPKPANWSHVWENGKYEFIPPFGAYEVAQNGEDKKTVRPIGSMRCLNLVKNNEGKWIRETML